MNDGYGVRPIDPSSPAWKSYLQVLWAALLARPIMSKMRVCGPSYTVHAAKNSVVVDNFFECDPRAQLDNPIVRGYPVGWVRTDWSRYLEEP